MLRSSSDSNLNSKDYVQLNTLNKSVQCRREPWNYLNWKLQFSDVEYVRILNIFEQKSVRFEQLTLNLFRNSFHCYNQFQNQCRWNLNKFHECHRHFVIDDCDWILWNRWFQQRYRQLTFALLTILQQSKIRSKFVEHSQSNNVQYYKTFVRMFRSIIVTMNRTLCSDDFRCENTIVKIEVDIRLIETYTFINRNFFTWLFLNFCSFTHFAHFVLKFFEFCFDMKKVFEAFDHRLIASI